MKLYEDVRRGEIAGTENLEISRYLKVWQCKNSVCGRQKHGQIPKSCPFACNVKNKRK
jgi:hypothetical protein